MEKKIIVTVNKDGSFSYEAHHLSNYEIIGIVEIIKAQTMRDIKPKTP